MVNDYYCLYSYLHCDLSFVFMLEACSRAWARRKKMSVTDSISLIQMEIFAVSTINSHFTTFSRSLDSEKERKTRWNDTQSKDAFMKLKLRWMIFSRHEKCVKNLKISYCLAFSECVTYHRWKCLIFIFWNVFFLTSNKKKRIESFAGQEQIHYARSYLFLSLWSLQLPCNIYKWSLIN